MSRTQTLFRLPRNHKCFLHSTLSILACSSTIPKPQVKEGVFEWLRWRFWRVCRCIRRCSSLVNEDARWEPWQGCHYKDEPPLNAPPKHTDLRALYPISHTLLHTIFTLARCTSSTYISQFIAATHLKFFFTFWSSGGSFCLKTYAG